MAKIELPKNNQELTHQKKVSKYLRNESIQNAVNKVLMIAIYSSLPVLSVWFILLIIHPTWIQDWIYFTDSFKVFLGAVGGYLFGALNKNLDPDN